MKVTQWFPGSVKPVYVGMYQRDCDGVSYSYWNGDSWSMCCFKLENALEALGELSFYPALPWRGMAE